MRAKPRWVEIVLLALPFAALAVLWHRLPERIPIHWDWNGEVDGWSSRAWGALLLPITNLALYLLLLYLPGMRSGQRAKAEPTPRNLAALGAVRLAITALLAFLFFVQIAMALDVAPGVPLNSGRLIANALLIGLLVMGNVFGNLPQNPYVGIRTPWTLRNEQTWRATHRHCGRLMVFGSLVLLLSQFFLRNIMPATIAFVILLAAWPLYYSWRHSTRLIEP